ncbi:ORF1339 [White spot syndrome virus]|uniref:ORF1339 n=1 Tax=White spot syndrome virus TaxID=342409 RepID=A0A2D3I563_9VIRU|nr:ORF1339 [White spot syndrome virus]
MGHSTETASPFISFWRLSGSEKNPHKSLRRNLLLFLDEPAAGALVARRRRLILASLAFSLAAETLAALTFKQVEAIFLTLEESSITASTSPISKAEEIAMAAAASSVLATPTLFRPPKRPLPNSSLANFSEVLRVYPHNPFSCSLHR